MDEKNTLQPLAPENFGSLLKVLEQLLPDSAMVRLIL